ncbi:hypothetical protein ISN75_06845 [Dyella marensis]|uniref:hypothetical protein n=1 Tax=Dyella marensis TaxID=500610 RepID=UPI0031DAD2EE
MAIGKRLTGSGLSPLQTTNIIGDVDPAVTAVGTNAATAYAIGSANTTVTTAASGTGLILPAGASPWDEYSIANRGANTIAIYPPTGGTINGGASATIATNGLGFAVCTSADGLTWLMK